MLIFLRNFNHHALVVPNVFFLLLKRKGKKPGGIYFRYLRKYTRYMYIYLYFMCCLGPKIGTHTRIVYMVIFKCIWILYSFNLFLFSYVYSWEEWKKEKLSIHSSLHFFFSVSPLPSLFLLMCLSEERVCAYTTTTTTTMYTCMKWYLWISSLENAIPNPNSHHLNCINRQRI